MLMGTSTDLYTGIGGVTSQIFGDFSGFIIFIIGVGLSFYFFEKLLYYANPNNKVHNESDDFDYEKNDNGKENREANRKNYIYEHRKNYKGRRHDDDPLTY